MLAATMRFPTHNGSKRCATLACHCAAYVLPVSITPAGEPPKSLKTWRTRQDSNL
jgi:hypothetical protein